jgi:zinc and cadmium transporter
MHELLWTLLATFVVSLISLIGTVTLVMSEKVLKKVLLALVGFSTGALIGGAFLHLLPESIEKNPSGNLSDIFLMAIFGFVVFFLLEKLLWRHCHERTCPIHVFAYLNLVGDGIHNFFDGLAMAASFVLSIPLGITTTLVIAAHEIPQEMGDFGVLVYGGLKPKKAVALNFITALTAVLGGITGYYLSLYHNVVTSLLPFAAGGFLYIAAADLVPELHKEVKTTSTVVSFASFLTGIFFIWGLRLLFGG